MLWPWARWTPAKGAQVDPAAYQIAGGAQHRVDLLLERASPGPLAEVRKAFGEGVHHLDAYTHERLPCGKGGQPPGSRMKRRVCPPPS